MSGGAWCLSVDSGALVHPRMDAETLDPAVQTIAPETLQSGLELIAARRLSNPEDARDAVQETLTRTLAAVRAGNIPAGVPVAAFAHGIACHIISDIQRRHAREQGARETDSDLADPKPCALTQMVNDERRDAVRDAMARLAPSDRDLLVSCYVNGVRIVDLARRGGVPAERLRKQKSRALSRLRDFLAGRHSPDTDECEP